MSLPRPLRSWALVFLGVVLAGFAAARGADDSERVGDLGRADRLVIRGLASFEVEQLRRPLLADPFLLGFSGPKGSRDTFLGAYARRAEQALKLAGFATATVVPTVETIDGLAKLVLTVNEGPRLDTGKVVIHGLPADLAARLEARLRAPSPTETARRHDVRRADGSTWTVWRKADGTPAPMRPALWPRLGPAPGDDMSMTDVRRLVWTFLQDEGYLDVAPPADPADPSPLGTARTDLVDAGIEATIDPGDGRRATLTIRVGALPPPARLTRIDVPRGATTTSEEIAAFLGISVGGPLTRQSMLECVDRLRESGRFLRAGLSEELDLLEAGGHILRFDLVEYAPMMPLSRPLSREEETVLRCRRWMFDALDDGRDLVIGIEPTGRVLDVQSTQLSFGETVGDRRLELTIGAEKKGAAIPSTPRTRSRLTISGTRGVALQSAGEDGQWHGIVASPERVRLVAPRGRGWFDVPSSIPVKLGLCPELSVGVASRGGEQQLQVDLRFRTEFDYPAVDAGGIHVQPSVPPVFCSVLLHHLSPQVHWDGDDLVIRHAGEEETRIDGRTGRPRTLCVLGQKVTVEERPGALAEADRAGGSIGRSHVRSDRPLSSAIRFLLAEGGLGLIHSVSAPMSVGDPGVPPLDPRAERIARLARQLDDEDVLAAVDGAIWWHFAPCPASPARSDLVLPALGASFIADGSAILRTLAIAVWRTSEGRLPPDSWPMILARATAGSTIERRVWYDEMAGFIASESPGPLACLAAASLAPDAALAATLARRGLEHATLEPFLADCRPLLLATADVDLASVVRGIVRGVDEESLAMLGPRLAADADAVVAVARRLRESDVATSADMEALLAAAWEGGLGEVVVRRLRELAASPPQRDQWGPLAGSTTTTVTIDGVTRSFTSDNASVSVSGDGATRTITTGNASVTISGDGSFSFETK